MKLATCAYTQFQPEAGVPVRVTVGKPRFRLAYPLTHTISELAPDAYTLKWEDQPRFQLHYTRKLAALGVDRIRELLAGVAAAEGLDPDAPDTTLVLLCFENLARPGMWCHRSMFAQWWTQETTELVAELGLMPGDAAFHQTTI